MGLFSKKKKPEKVKIVKNLKSFVRCKKCDFSQEIMNYDKFTCQKCGYTEYKVIGIVTVG